jgi:MFS family permease
LLVATHAVNIGLVIAVVTGAGVVDVFDGPGRQSFLNNMVDRARLGNAIALNSIVVNSARIAGPGAAGVIIATFGVAPCFFANTVSFAAIILSLLAMRPSELLPSRREVRARGQIRAAVRHVAGTPELLTALLMVTVTGMFAWEFQVTLPLLTSLTFHGTSAAYGTAVSCLAFGSIAGGLAAARRRLPTRRSIAISAIIWGALILAASAAPTLPIAYALLAFVGAGAVTFSSACKTLLQLESAEHMRGRVMSLWFIGWQGSTVVGAPIIGVAAQAYGGRVGLGLGGAITLLAGALALFIWWRHRTVERVPIEEPAPEPASAQQAHPSGQLLQRQGQQREHDRQQ